MEQENFPGQWTEDQWSLVQQTVRDEARKVRVARSFLPVDGPLAPETDSVKIQPLIDGPGPGLRLPGEAQSRLEVDDRRTQALTNISVNVYLRNSQVAQPDLSSALSMFRRAANIIARCEDRLIFQGQPANLPGNYFNPIPSVFTVTTGGAQWFGLRQTGIFWPPRNVGDPPHRISVPGSRAGWNARGTNLFVNDVSAGVSRLENEGHLRPFVLVLGHTLFEIAHDPTLALVMPADRIKPMLEGPLLRSSTLPPFQGVLLSLAGDPFEVVVPSDISVKFLQVTMEPRHVYRVSQRFTFRVKQAGAVISYIN